MHRLPLQLRNLLATPEQHLSDLPWRAIAGVLCALAPALLALLLASDMPASAVAAAMVAGVAVATYIAGWAGALVCIASGAVALELLFIGEGWRFDAPTSSSERTGLLLALLAALVVAWVIQRVKQENLNERQSTLAARTAATALSAIETVAATNPNLDVDSRRRLHEATLRSLIGINRAHAGLLYLENEESAELTLAAAYGFGSQQDRLPATIDEQSSFFGDVIDQRRVLSLNRSSAQDAHGLPSLRGSRIRSLIAAPITSPEGELLGLFAVALLVPHQYRPAEIRRLEALSNQVAAILDLVSATGARERLLSEAQGEIRRLEGLIAALPEAVVVASVQDGAIIAANEAAISLFGDLDSQPLSTHLLLPDRSPCPPELLPMQVILDGQSAAVDIELIAITDDGRETPVLASASAIVDSSGALTAVVGAFRDILPLKEASRIRDEFVSVVSHELRSPLTPIRGFVQLVARELEREGGHATQVAWLKSISGHVDRMTRLVDDLLDVSGLRSGALEIRPQDVDLVVLCQDVVTVRSATATNFTIEFTPLMPQLHGLWDGARLQQVVDNLVGNAIKYGNAGGMIRVTVDHDPSNQLAIIAVEDDGPGIESGDIDRVFSPFVRTDRAMSSQTPGLGLGLYICRELVRAHDGDIEIGRSNLGGARVIVTLPNSRITPVPNPAAAVTGSGSALAQDVMSPGDHASGASAI